MYNNLLENRFQLACKAFHYTETVLLSAQNDILDAMEKEQVTTLSVWFALAGL